jgi:hypothetical protein
MDWKGIDIAPPPEGKPLWTKIHDGHGERNVQKLTRIGRLWYAGEMYVYYTPTHWAEIEEQTP